MSTKKEKPKHLGRGLQSLLGPIMKESDDTFQANPITAVSPNISTDKELRDSLQQISLSEIKPNPCQPRSEWDMEDLEELSNSIKSSGVIQPIIVRSSENFFF